MKTGIGLQLHENLLLRHHTAFQPTLAASSSSYDAQDPSSLVHHLQGLHQTVLSRIRSRHATLAERTEVWEQYRSSLKKFLLWIDATEREKKRRLEMRRLQEHSLPTSTHRVEVLLDNVPHGQALLVDLEKRANKLVEELGAESGAEMIRADVASAKRRLVNLESWLCTWRDFLQRLARQYHNFNRGIEAIRVQLQTIQNDLVPDHKVPTDYQAAAQLLQKYRVSFQLFLLLELAANRFKEFWEI